MIVSSRHISHLAVAGLLCLSAVAVAQPPDGMSKKEYKQQQKQERHDAKQATPGTQGGGGGGHQNQGPNQNPAMQMQQGPGGPSGPPVGAVPSGPVNFNTQGGGGKHQKQNDVPIDDSASVKQLKKNKVDEKPVQLESTPITGGVQLQDAGKGSGKHNGGGQGQGQNQGQGQGQGKGKGKVDVQDVPGTVATPFVPEGTPGGDLTKKQQNRLDNLNKQNNNAGNEGNKPGKGNKGKGEVPGADATPFVPAGTPPGGENFSKKQQHQLEQDQKKEQNRLEKLEKKGGLTPAAGAGEAVGTPVGQIDLNKGKGQGKNKKGDVLATPGAGANVNPANPMVTPGAGLSKHELKQQMKDTKQTQQAANQAAKQLDKLTNKQEKLQLKNLSGAEKAALIGTNAGNLNIDASKKLSKNDAITVIGDNNTIIKNKYVDKTIIENNHGYPDHWDHNDHHNHHDDDDWWKYGAVIAPLINLAYGCHSCLPPAPVLGVGYGGLSWNYWDGHSYYDQGYCDSIYLGIGHYRYNGCDGAYVGGSYYSYGYGYIDGCYDYGDRRMWVPGFWAPYTVEECGSVPYWVPPAYEDVWTGCCWETVQVDGGYFAPSATECHWVTRYTWVPGHFEAYLI